MSTVLGPQVGYIDLLAHETTEAIRKAETEGKKYHPLRPSSSGKCSRELYFEFMEYLGRAKFQKETRSPELERIFNLGHHIERHLIQQFEKNLSMFELRYKQQVLSFYVLEAKNDPSLAHRVEGSLDTVLYSPEHRAVVDFKSKKDKFSSFFRTNWDEQTEKLKAMKTVTTLSETAFWVDDLEAFLEELRDPFFEQNFLQLNGYACNPFLVERGVDHGAVIQSNKNDSRLREVRFRPSMKLYERVRLKFQGVVDAVDQGNIELAPKDYFLGSLKCGTCPFKAECWKEDALKEYFGTLPPKKWPTDTSRLGAAGKQLEEQFFLYRAQGGAVTARAQAEEDILKLMEANKVSKLRLENGEVYEAKFLKTPRPHLELRRSKA